MTSSLDNIDPEIEQRVGTLVSDKYRIERVIGQGGMGAVYEAVHTAINKRVALKFLTRDAAQDLDKVMRFQREAEAASAVDSAHIVEIFDWGSSDDSPFLVMELLRGEDLRARLQREGKLTLEVMLHIAGQMLRALHRAHEAGIVHRDLKPDNIFLCERDDDPLFVKLVDFGISKLARAGNANNLTRRGTILGTAFYMSPEQAQGFADVDGRTDLFSVGAIMYEALTGEPPFSATSYEAVLVSICTQDAPDVRKAAPDVPEAMANVIAKALARDRNERFQSAEEFYAALCAVSPGSLPQRMLRGAPMLPAPARAETLTKTGSERSGELATGAGAALRSRSAELRLQRRRTAVMGLMAALTAFAVSAFWMSYRARRHAAEALAPAPISAVAESVTEPKSSALPASASSAVPHSQPAAAASGSSLPSPPSSGVAEPSRSEPSRSEPDKLEARAQSAEAKPKAPRKKPPATSSTTVRRASSRSKPPKTAPQEKPSSGVMGGLELKTSGP